MTSVGRGPSIPVAIASILLIAGLAATAIVMTENPPPVSSLVPTAEATAGVVALGGSPSPSSTVAAATAGTAQGSASAGPTASAALESPAPTPTAEATPAATTEPTPEPTADPSPAPTPGPTRKPKKSAVPTRVQVASLGVDVAVIAPLPRGRPRCGVAEWLEPLAHPAAGGTTYLYANAMKGMFGPIYTAVRKDEESVKGEMITVWTSDDFAWTYKVTSVRRRQSAIEWAFSLPADTLVVQTADSPGVMMLVARLVARTPSEGDEAHPVARPRTCP